MPDRQLRVCAPVSPSPATSTAPRCCWTTSLTCGSA